MQRYFSYSRHCHVTAVTSYFVGANSSLHSYKTNKEILPKKLPNTIYSVFQNRCLRRILQIYWPNTITNEELHQRAEIEPISTQVKRRRWQWIGHVLRQQTTALTRIALRWTPDGQRKRGRPKETWRTVEREMKEKGWTWGHLERVSADRHRWRALVEALCATWSTKRTRSTLCRFYHSIELALTGHLTIFKSSFPYQTFSPLSASSAIIKYTAKSQLDGLFKAQC